MHKAGRIRHPKLIARYLGRYVRHPAIANSRLTYFDGSKVGFFYEVSIEKSNEKIRHDITMQAGDFVSALIQHIPEPQFKMIRYYGAYAKRTKKTFRAYLQSSIEQTKLTRFGVKIPEKTFHCPYCGGDLEFVMYMDKGPPEIPKSQKELVEWISGNSKN